MLGAHVYGWFLPLQLAAGLLVRPYLQRFIYWFEGYLAPSSSWRWAK